MASPMDTKGADDPPSHATSRVARGLSDAAINSLDFGRLRFGEGGLLCLDVPRVAAPFPRLSAAELRVAQAILRGNSAADIARARDASVRTMAKQVVSVLRGLAGRRSSRVDARTSFWGESS
jgi:DNA-binding NarL/FixJ family response regulator